MHGRGAARQSHGWRVPIRRPQAQRRLRPPCGARRGLRRVRRQSVGVGYRVPARAAGRLSGADFLSLRYKFDTLLYVRDTLAFGRESDIDQNGVVIVLMTNAVNQLVSASECSAGFVAGYFYGADLIFGQGNNGEIFYSLVADPLGALSCPHSVAQVNSLVPGTFIPEVQHMISFGQHYLKPPGAPQGLW